MLLLKTPGGSSFIWLLPNSLGNDIPWFQSSLCALHHYRHYYSFRYDHAIGNVKQPLFTYSRYRFGNSAIKLPGNFLILYRPKNLYLIKKILRHSLTKERITCLITFNGQGYLRGRNLTPLEKVIPTTELVWFTSSRDTIVMEPSRWHIYLVVL